MESFLKYLRGGAAAVGNQRAPVVATTIAASVSEDGGGGEVDDDASFFDLEFAVPGDESAASDAEEERVEFNFDVVASGGGAEVVAVDADATGGECGDGKKEDKDKDKDGAEEAAPATASLLRPATKFGVLLLKLRKPKGAEGINGGAPAAAAKTTTTNRFLIKFRVDEAPVVSLFTRDNSSRTSDAGGDRVTAEERRFAKEVVLKYLNKIKPLYVKVSRLRFAGASEGEETDAEPDPATSVSGAPPQPATHHLQPVVVACGVRAPRASVPAGLKQVCKRLGKSRSASSAVAAAPSPTPPPAPATPQRRDDSLLQVQDGIQSAIAHCKRSFNASKGSESPLLRSMTTTGDAADTTDGGDGGK